MRPWGKTRSGQQGGGSVFRRWLLSYLLIVLVPILGSGATYATAYRMINREVAQANSVALVSAQMVIDSRLSKMRDIAVSILRDERFHHLASAKNTEIDFIRKQREFTAQVSAYQTTAYEMDIFIYFPAIDCVVTTTAGGPLSRFSDALNYTAGKSVDAGDWRKAILEAEPNTYRHSSVLSYDKYGREALVYTSELSTALEPGCLEARVFISAQLDGLLPRLAVHDQSMVLMLDSQGNVISNPPGNLDEFRLASDAGSGGMETVLLGGQEFVCTYLSSNAGPFIYAIATPSELFWSKHNTIIATMATGIVISAAVGVYVAWRMLKRNYTPLRDTLSILPQDEDDQRDEFKRIASQLTHLSDNQLLMRDSLTRQQRYLKESYLCLLLRGDAAYLSSDDIVDELQLDLAGKVLLPVSITVVNENDWALLQSMSRDGGDGGKISLTELIEKALSDELGDTYPFMLTYADGAVTLVFTLEPEQRDLFSAAIAPALERLCAYFLDQLKLVLRAVIGGGSESIEGLSASYRSMLPFGALENGGQAGRVVWAKALVAPQNPLDLRLASFTSLLMDAVNGGAYDDAKHVVNLLFAELAVAPEPFTSKRFFVFSLISRVYGVYVSLAPKDITRPHSLMDLLVSCSTLDQLSHVFVNIVKITCEHEEDERKTSQRPELYSRVQEYIAEHYADPGLCLTQIADHVGMSPQYVSKLFKLETRQGLLSYINTVRIGKAKEILAEKSASVNDAGARVGYTTNKTFRRAFQKVEGVNPGAYKPGQ